MLTSNGHSDISSRPCYIAMVFMDSQTNYFYNHTVILYLFNRSAFVYSRIIEKLFYNLYSMSHAVLRD